jgi:dienelactone hydrolase
VASDEVEKGVMPVWQARTRRELLRGLSVLAIGRAENARLSNFFSLLQAGSAADETKPWKGSALGNLYPFIKRQQEKTRQSLAFLHRRPKDLEAWKAEGRAKVFELLSYRPEAVHPRPRILDRIDRGDYIQERLNFSTTPDVEVPCYFLIPKRAKFPVPAVVALHDHGGFYYWGKEKLVESDDEHPMLAAYRKEYYDGASFPAALAQRGYAVIVIDMFYHGERRLILDEDLENRTNDRSKSEPNETIRKINHRAGSSEEIVFRNILHSGFTWGGVLVWDDIRTVDYLRTRPEVDPNRIACAGLSAGGWRTVFLAGLDPRIKAACVVGWMTSFHYLIPHHEIYTVPSGMIPGLLEYLDYPDIATLAMPCPLLVVHGQQDTLFPPEGVKAAMDTLQRSYQALGRPERFDTWIFDGPHKFPLAAQRKMMDWFDRWV